MEVPGNGGDALYQSSVGGVALGDEVRGRLMRGFCVLIALGDKPGETCAFGEEGWTNDKWVSPSIPLSFDRAIPVDEPQLIFGYCLLIYFASLLDQTNSTPTTQSQRGHCDP